MKTKHHLLAAAAVATLAGTVAAQAHHGRASYSDEIVTLEATVTEFRFINPHVQIYFDITNEAGEIEHWQGELTAPNRLARAGWTKTTFVPGDRLTITGEAARNDGKSVAIREIIMDGKSLPLRETLP
ncbi:MAG: hypothetical protein GWN29_06050 [Gammaproteobacteria bacterium]|nr:hypothetical protein [Gammaproteobacteria bacterium]